MNDCRFTGNLVADPEARTTNSGKSVTSFKIAVNEGYGDNKHVEFIPCTAWEKQAELIANYCHKGSKVLVAGRWNTNEWTDKEGNKRYTVQLIIREIEFLTPKSEQQDSYSGPSDMGTGSDTPF